MQLGRGGAVERAQATEAFFSPRPRTPPHVIAAPFLPSQASGYIPGTSTGTGTSTNTMHMLRLRPVHQAFVAIANPVQVVQRHCFSAPSSPSSASDQDLQIARSWLAKLHADTVPLKSIGELTFSRSSGPGGQNVNKYARNCARKNKNLNDTY